MAGAKPKSLRVLGEAIEQAVLFAAADMQEEMGKELKQAMLNTNQNLWAFKFWRNDQRRRVYPYSNSGDRTGESGELYKSQTPWGPFSDKTSVRFGFEWAAVYKSGREYASLVHNGGFNIMGEMEWPKKLPLKNYSARPWTFLVTPPEQRNIAAIVNPGPVNLSTLPSDGWEACYKVFRDSFRDHIRTVVKVVPV